MLAGALAAFVAGERNGRQRWYALCGVLLGAGFLTREASSVLFALPLGLKDVRLVLEAADAQRVPMPIASVLHDRFLTALARGHERSDWSVVGQVAAEDAGLARAQSA